MKDDDSDCRNNTYDVRSDDGAHADSDDYDDDACHCDSNIVGARHGAPIVTHITYDVLWTVEW